MLRALDTPAHNRVNAGLAASPARQRRRVDARVADMWRESLQVMAHHSAGILGFAFLGFAVPALVSATVAGYFGWRQYAIPGTITANTFAVMFWWQWGLQAGMALLLMPVARGVMGWLALHHDSALVNVTGWNALKATLKRWPALLFTVVVYGGLLCAGAYALMLLMRDLRLDTSSQGVGFTRPAPDAQQLFRTFGIRTLQGLIPNPGSPFSEVLEFIRFDLRQVPASRYVTTLLISPANGEVSLERWLIGGGAALAMLLGESLFRMRFSVLMHAPRPNLFTGLVGGLKIGWRWFGRLTLHITLLRLAQFVFLSLFIVMPLTLGQTLVLPRLTTLLGTQAAITIGNLALNALGTPVTMLFVAFLAVYDARLYLRLVQAKPGSGVINSSH